MNSSPKYQAPVPKPGVPVKPPAKGQLPIKPPVVSLKDSMQRRLQK